MTSLDGIPRLCWRRSVVLRHTGLGPRAAVQEWPAHLLERDYAQVGANLPVQVPGVLEQLDEALHLSLLHERLHRGIQFGATALWNEMIVARSRQPVSVIAAVVIGDATGDLIPDCDEQCGRRPSAVCPDLQPSRDRGGPLDHQVRLIEQLLPGFHVIVVCGPHRATGSVRAELSTERVGHPPLGSVPLVRYVGLHVLPLPTAFGRATPGEQVGPARPVDTGYIPGQVLRRRDERSVVTRQSRRVGRPRGLRGRRRRVCGALRLPPAFQVPAHGAEIVGCQPGADRDVGESLVEVGLRAREVAPFAPALLYHLQRMDDTPEGLGVATQLRRRLADDGPRLLVGPSGDQIEESRALGIPEWLAHPHRSWAALSAVPVLGHRPIIGRRRDRLYTVAHADADTHAVAPRGWPRFDRGVAKGHLPRPTAVRVAGQAGPEAPACSRGAAADAAEVIVETVDAPDAQAILARWAERLARLGRERLAPRVGDQPGQISKGTPWGEQR